VTLFLAIVAATAALSVAVVIVRALTSRPVERWLQDDADDEPYRDPRTDDLERRILPP
jgi:hypothetical protein